MSQSDNNQTVNAVVGTVNEDDLGGAGVDKVNGHAGSDVISTGGGSDLAAGDMVGNEWQFINGKWVFDANAIVTYGQGVTRDYDDTIQTGDGDDVILGNGGRDLLRSGTGDDLINAGTGDDIAFGGAGNDILNLESGSDIAEGGRGADVVNAGYGDDVVYGDERNILMADPRASTTSMTQYGANGDWTVTDTDGSQQMTQTVSTEPGDTYTISFEVAANLSGGAQSGALEVVWDGQVIGTVETTSGVYEKHQIDVPAGVSQGELTFREVTPTGTGPALNIDGPIAFYDKQMDIGGQDVDVAAFAPGQAKLYQMISGQLNVFDTASETYQTVGDPTGLGINAVGFNVQDDLIYGIAKREGTDSLGNPVSIKDLVMVDAEGNAYRIGETPVADFTGDFDADGNLWTFDSRANRVTKIDVDNLDADGNPVSVNYDLPDDLFNGRAYDVAYNAEEDVFFAVQSPSTNGGHGQVHKIDISQVETGGEPSISSLPITGTLYDDGMANGMAKGAYGAVFMDGDGNLYYGLNRGDHDLDSSTDATGGIFKVNMDWDDGTAYSEFMADATATGSNDGAVDPRAADPFADIDASANILIRNPEMRGDGGGDDDLRGGHGDDEMYGGGGDDILNGGVGDDTLSGDAGDDKVYGGEGDDTLSGGKGNDNILGGDGDDTLNGGAGQDFLMAGNGDDILSGGAGTDKLVGGAGSDRIEGGAGDDHMWGGNWWKDGSQDTFVVSAGSGKDMIHDFETSHDQIDLSSYGVEYADVTAAMTDKGWATEIDLSQLTGGQSTDKLIIKSVDADDLDETNFIL